MDGEKADMVFTDPPYNIDYQGVKDKRDKIANDKMSDEDKLEKFGISFVKLTEITVDVVCGCITSIDTPQGTVDDPAMIKEFMQNSSSAVFNTINDHVNAMKESMALNSQQVQCTECQHEWKVEVTMDQANFFVAGS